MISLRQHGGLSYIVAPTKQSLGGFMGAFLLALAMFGSFAHGAVIGWPSLNGVDDQCTQVAMDAAIKNSRYTKKQVYSNEVDVEFFEVSFNSSKADSFEYVLSVGEQFMSVVVNVRDPLGPNRKCLLDRANSTF